MDNSIVISAPDAEAADEVFTAGALAFLEALHRRFAGRRRELLDLRQVRRETVALHGTLDFLPETAEVRSGDWRVAPIPEYLADRRVEITGPTDRKMTINALNSGAQVWLADLEDANTPAWPNIVEGQLSLRDAIRGTITLEQNGRSYRLDDGPLAVIVARPRGWHLDEKHLAVDGERLVGALVDFGLYLFHNAQVLLDRGRGPAFYLPKMESHLEARLWAEVFAFSEEYLGLEHGVVKATVLIETIWAAFEMDEILYELRDHIVGLNAGRWDYLFSIVKTFRDAGPAFVLPERQVVTMASPFMKAYSDLLVQTCHRRGAYAIGGMAAFIPSRRDAAVNDAAFAKVRADKTREADAGYEGSWVAHPDLVPICREIFDGALGGRRHQLDRELPPVAVTAHDLLDVASVAGPVTMAGLRDTIAVALEYIANWLAGRGAVAIHHLMEDAATAEISRSLVWQWRVAGVVLDTGRPVTDVLVTEVLDAATEQLSAAWTAVPGGLELLAQARNLMFDLCNDDSFIDFLTLPAYELLD
ncbi:malate synthase A [Nakamurella deserti]|uniref:malate synthase A n=1 Tax=Nakamurella deserti TaxID=2164074 RepID=UPI00147858F1|nr:malate synthase A [Nakamurella deserti]